MIINSLKDLNLNEDKFPIFFQEKWKKSAAAGNGTISYYYDETDTCCIAFRVTSLKIIRKADYLYVPLNTDGERLSVETEKRVLDRFHAFLKANAVCDVICPPQHVVVFKAIPSKVTYFPIGIIYISLKESEDEIFARMHSNYRNEIRKAIKEGITPELGSAQLSDFYALYKATHQRQHLLFDPIEQFEKLQSGLFPNFFTSYCTFNSSVESSTVNIFDAENAYYLYAGTREKTLLPGSNKYLIWENARHFKNQGIKRYILGGYRPNSEAKSKHHGIQNFKLKFGAEIDEGYHFIKVINQPKFLLFSLAIKIKETLQKRDLSLVNLKGLEIKKSR